MNLRYIPFSELSDLVNKRDLTAKFTKSSFGCTNYSCGCNSKIPNFDYIYLNNFITAWFGIIFIRQGIYQEAVFRFKIQIPENYPDGDCPRLFFDHPVYHPIVDPDSNELDVKRGFHKWRRNVNHIWQILLYTRRCFYKFDTKDALNCDAAHL